MDIPNVIFLLLAIELILCFKDIKESVIPINKGNNLLENGF